MLSPEYLAGLFDGEGMVRCASPVEIRPNQKSEWIQIGCWHFQHTHKPIWAWKVCAKETQKRFLLTIQPSRMKR